MEEKKPKLHKVETGVSKLSERFAPTLFRYTQTAGSSIFDEVVSRVFGSMARLVVFLESIATFLLHTLGNFYLMIAAILVALFALVQKLVMRPLKIRPGTLIKAAEAPDPAPVTPPVDPV